MSMRCAVRCFLPSLGLRCIQSPVVVVVGLVDKSCLTLVTPWAVACQAPLSMGFPRQEYWSRLLFASPRDHLDPGIEPRSPTWQAVF